ncbi:Hypothetical predicted protein [Mytilus galloprovincialis]|uniref:Uncharacterized protein n=1 Tax=Mytilus galloprovincialis TaxID=29158 RepID=A0A8B6BYR0_MYTGA|nr:Hypothetical predicted protein [Mytilus galloprovincialis]
MDYIDLKRSKLYVKLKVKKANGEDLQDGDTVGPVNLILQSLWSQLDVYIQGQMVTSSNTYYPYKCMMKTLLQYGQDAKSTQLSSSLYLKDRYGHMDEISTNTGLYERRKFISNSKTLEMEGPIFSDIFEMDRYLLNMLSLKLKLYRNDPSFCLMSGEIDTNYHISLEDVVIKLCSTYTSIVGVWVYFKVRGSPFWPPSWNLRTLRFYGILKKLNPYYCYQVDERSPASLKYEDQRIISEFMDSSQSIEWETDSQRENPELIEENRKLREKLRSSKEKLKTLKLKLQTLKDL